jgi:hypothetical protein
MIDVPNSKEDRLSFLLDFAWQILFERICSGRTKINKESSLQLHYSVVIHGLGEVLCISPNEEFRIELESSYKKKNIDIVCAFDDIKAAIELKCFRKSSNRATDTDMYDVLLDLARLHSYSDFKVKRFFCLTDNAYYPNAPHSGHAGSVSIRNGVSYAKGVSIAPSWAGKWSHKGRDNPIVMQEDVSFNWSEKDGWYFLKIVV